MKNKIKITVGVQTIVLNDNRILLGKRKNVFHGGNWGLPGGQLEPRETIFQAAKRELEEETGLIAQKMKVICVTDPTKESNFHMQIGVLVMQYSGSPIIKEPNKCSDLSFFDMNSLPRPLFLSSIAILKNFSNNSFYTENIES